MPLPLIAVAAIAITATAGGGAGAAAIRMHKPKQVLLVGPRGAGKTTLAALLGDDSAAIAVESSDETHRFTFDFSWLSNKAQALDIIDTPGGDSAQEAIRKFAPRSRLVCLVVSALDPKGTTATDSPLRLAKQIVHCAGKKTRPILIVTHSAPTAAGETATLSPKLREVIDALGPADIVHTNLLDDGQRERVAQALADAVA